MKVIGTLKKITLQESRVVEENGEGETEVTSLDIPRDQGSSSPRYNVVSIVITWPSVWVGVSYMYMYIEIVPYYINVQYIHM